MPPFTLQTFICSIVDMKTLIRNSLKMSLNVNQAFFPPPEMPNINALSGINVEYKHFIQGALKLLS